MHFLTLITLFIAGAVALPADSPESTNEDGLRIMAKRDTSDDLQKWAGMTVDERKQTLADFHDLIRGTSDQERPGLCSNDPTKLWCTCASDDTECKKGAKGRNKDKQIALYFKSKFLECQKTIEESKGADDKWLWSNMKCRNQKGSGAGKA
ncbi:hypothetical protein GQ602_001471 [Ophiocordyceps camponoti-floridani]|uniref:Uncharacterized protein n=1 Tax=Ophiocordyceps camponoti-floridani TaxID=2030778 RepID=A0A8H4VH91_9HYPO|nr:hypothetical protein GQ602_001471 [Ophiocordyceps camponoti-floridani]